MSMAPIPIVFLIAAVALAPASAAKGRSEQPVFAWPVSGKVVDDDDGKPCPARYEGIDIDVPEGTEVRASLSGTVIYAGGAIRGFGNLVLIRHRGGWVTVYGHNSELYVNRGERVETGDVIARTGSTGFVSSPQLHFEIRKGPIPWNPAEYLALLKEQAPELP
jgi:murein DD-endopeptidase MepM/ murein hydrolase activator NlpD